MKVSHCPGKFCEMISLDCSGISLARLGVIRLVRAKQAWPGLVLCGFRWLWSILFDLIQAQAPVGHKVKCLPLTTANFVKLLFVQFVLVACGEVGWLGGQGGLFRVLAVSFGHFRAYPSVVI